MFGPLPGLATGLMAMLTMSLAGVGTLVHLVVAAILGRKHPNAFSTTLGPVVCFFVGLGGAAVGHPLDDVALAIPIVGVTTWVVLSALLGARARVARP